VIDVALMVEGQFGLKLAALAAAGALCWDSALRRCTLDHLAGASPRPGHLDL